MVVVVVDGGGGQTRSLAFACQIYATRSGLTLASHTNTSPSGVSASGFTSINVASVALNMRLRQQPVQQ